MKVKEINIYTKERELPEWLSEIECTDFLNEEIDEVIDKMLESFPDNSDSINGSNYNICPFSKQTPQERLVQDIIYVLYRYDKEQSKKYFNLLADINNYVRGIDLYWISEMVDIKENDIADFMEWQDIWFDFISTISKK